MYVLTQNNIIATKKQANHLENTKYYCYLCSVQNQSDAKVADSMSAFFVSQTY